MKNKIMEAVVEDVKFCGPNSYITVMTYDPVMPMDKTGRQLTALICSRGPFLIVEGATQPTWCRSELTRLPGVTDNVMIEVAIIAGRPEVVAWGDAFTWERVSAAIAAKTVAAAKNRSAAAPRISVAPPKQKPKFTTTITGLDGLAALDRLIPGQLVAA